MHYLYYWSDFILHLNTIGRTFMYMIDLQLLTCQFWVFSIHRICLPARIWCCNKATEDPGPSPPRVRSQNCESTSASERPRAEDSNQRQATGKAHQKIYQWSTADGNKWSLPWLLKAYNSTSLYSQIVNMSLQLPNPVYICAINVDSNHDSQPLW